MSRIIESAIFCQSSNAYLGDPGELWMSATISEYIEHDLAGRIGTEQVSPAALTLHSLSRHYGVSPTPVREAIRRLLADGTLVRQSNGRLAVNRASGKTARRRPRRQEESGPPQRALDLESELAAEVIRKSLRGDGDYVREEVTAERFGVGRTAIRQAFSQLAGRGLIVHVPRCGWRVRTFDEEDLVAYLEIREVLENKALALARPHLVDADLRRMLAGNASSTMGSRLDNSLHRYLVEKSGNDYLQEFFNRHGAYYTSLLDFAAPETHVVADMARQHRKILRALLAKDWPRARRELARHIRAQRPIVGDLLQRIGRKETCQASEQGRA
jgi:DNA-binding GntR family transcriptional regulator